MFFDNILLCRQLHSTIRLAWVAGTRGSRLVKKQEMLNLNMDKLCSEILKYVVSSSMRPTEKFSLRLSAILINGVLRIQLLRWNSLYEDVYFFITRINKPLVLDDVAESEKSVRLAKKGKKRPRVQASSSQSTPDFQKLFSEVLNLEKPLVRVDFSDVVRDESAITLTNLQYTRQTVEVAETGADFGPSLPMIAEESFDAVAELDLAVLEPIILPEYESLEPQPKKRFASPAETESEEGSARLIQTTAQVHVDWQGHCDRTVTIQRHVSPEERMDTEQIVDRIEPEKQPEISPIQSQQLTSESSGSRLKRKRGKPKGVVAPTERGLNNLFIKTEASKRVRRINFCERDEVDIVKVIPVFHEEWRMRSINVKHLLDKYVLEEKLSPKPTVEDERRRKSREISASPVIAPALSVSPGDLVLRGRPSLLIDDGDVTTIPSLRDTTLMNIMPLETSVRPTLTATDMELTCINQPQSTAISPEFPQSSPIASSIHLPRVSEFGTGVELTKRDRLRIIIERIANSDAKTFTLEDLAEKPFKKLTIALAFQSLLELSASGYVNLISEDNSTDLKHIERGRKFDEDPLRLKYV